MNMLTIQLETNVRKVYTYGDHHDLVEYFSNVPPGHPLVPAMFWDNYLLKT